MICSQAQPEMHLNGDIPVVEVEGEWSESTGRTLSDLIQRLAIAGHLEIIVNLTQMIPDLQRECRWMETLERIGTAVRRQCGRLDVVGTLEQTQHYVHRQTHAGLLWATSEEEAVGHIKGLPVYHSGPKLKMRLSC